MTNTKYEDMKQVYLHKYTGQICDALRSAHKEFAEVYRTSHYQNASWKVAVFLIPALLSWFLWFAHHERIGMETDSIYVVVIMGIATWSFFTMKKYHNDLVEDFFNRNECRVVVVRFMMETREDMIRDAGSPEEAEEIADFFEIALQDIPRNVCFKWESWHNAK